MIFFIFSASTVFLFQKKLHIRVNGILLTVLSLGLDFRNRQDILFKKHARIKKKKTFQNDFYF
jgi:hypothetical protein